MSWLVVAADADVAEGAMVSAEVQTWHVVVARHEGELHAFSDRCTHQASPLSTGRLRRGAFMCPLHGARFEVASGKCIGGIYGVLRRFPVRVIAGAVEVELPDHPPGLEDLPFPSP